MSTSPSLRELARTLGLSHTTVSEALRNNPRVREETKRKVIRAAEAAGYRRNPLAGALMSEIRRSRAGTFRGVIAIIDSDGISKRPLTASRYHREMIQGATERAQELGFMAELFSVQREISTSRLDSILQSRGIRGLLLLPVHDDPDFSHLNWSHYAGVYADYIIERPQLHAVCSDHYRALIGALNRLRNLGYRRPGLVLQQHNDERLLNRWEAAFQAYLDHHTDCTHLPPLILPEITKDKFVSWFKKQAPDVVLCHRTETMSWMEECGATIPTSHGFCCLNVITNSIPCSGLDLQPRLLGARGVELVIAQIFRNEYGIPEIPSTTTIPARWVDGPTLPALKPQQEAPNLSVAALGV
ncbi:MAG: LacI family DNA-binding transcriptional regulator [Nibricoccus sp.]